LPAQEVENSDGYFGRLRRADKNIQALRFKSKCALQYQPVLCRVSGNLSGCVFLLELDFAIMNIFNCNQLIEQVDGVVHRNLVVVEVVVNTISEKRRTS